MLKNLAEKIEYLVEYLAGFLFLLIFLINIYQVFIRYFMSSSYAWVPDISILLLNWVIFLGGSVAFYNHDHLRLDLLLNKLNNKKEFILDLFLFVLKISLFVTMIIYGYQVASVRMGIYLTGISIPSGYIYIAVPVGGLLMLFFQVVHIIEDFDKMKK